MPRNVSIQNKYEKLYTLRTITIYPDISSRRAEIFMCVGPITADKSYSGIVFYFPVGYL